MIAFNDLPQSAQKAYKVTNTVRKVTMFLSYVVAVICIIPYINDGIFQSIFQGIWVGGIIHGIVHFEFIFKTIMRKTSSVGIIGSLFGLFICAFILCLAVPFIGGIFLIIDTVLFVQKKSLIYPFENKCFLNSKQAQKEIAEALWEDYTRKQNSDNVMETLQKLKEVFEQGVISEDEYNAKKAELLERI